MSQLNVPVWAVSSVLAIAISSAVPAHAAFVFNIQPDGQGNIVANGSGTLNLTAIEGYPVSGQPPYAFVDGGAGYLFAGSMPFAAGSAEGYQYMAANRLSFGFNNVDTLANTSSGDIVGLAGVPYHAIFVPSTYVSGNYLSDNATWDNSTLNSLGLEPGSYEFYWGINSTFDSLTVNILSSPVPEPASLSLVGIGAAALLSRRQRAV
jgi:hypothetical protein